MQEFVLINYVIVSKILKYYIKRAGTGTDFERRLLVKLPSTMLYGTRPLLELMSKAEALVAGDVSIGKVMLMNSSARRRVLCACVWTCFSEDSDDRQKRSGRC